MSLIGSLNTLSSNTKKKLSAYQVIISTHSSDKAKGKS